MKNGKTSALLAEFMDAYNIYNTEFDKVKGVMDNLRNEKQEASEVTEQQEITT